MSHIQRLSFHDFQIWGEVSKGLGDDQAGHWDELAPSCSLLVCFSDFYFKRVERIHLHFYPSQHKNRATSRE